MDANSPFKLENDQWVIDVPKLELVLPEANVIEDGEYKMIFGFGPLMIEENEDGSVIQEATLTLATKFVTKPVEVEHDRENKEYTYIYYKKYNEDFPFCVNKNFVKDITNVEYMFKLISGGKVSTRIDWRDYMEIILNNMEMNKALDVSERDIEILLAEYLRDAENPAKPRRLTGSDDYTVLSFRALTNAQSTFSSIMFEDPETALTTSLSRKKSDESVSPLEKYMKI